VGKRTGLSVVVRVYMQAGHPPRLPIPLFGANYMSPRQARRERREAERKARKAELKRAKAAAAEPGGTTNSASGSRPLCISGRLDP